MGRFIQADTLVPSPTNSQSLNRYMFVDANPLRYTDPDGHIPTVVAGGLIGAAVGLVGYSIATAINPNSDWNLGEAALVIATGAAAGALIGTGIGAATCVSLFTAQFTTSVGVGVASGAAWELVANSLTQSSFDSASFAISSVGGGVSGGLTSLVPGHGIAPASIRSTISGGVAVMQYGAEQITHGRSMNFGDAMTTFNNTAVAQFAGEAVSDTLFGLPQHRDGWWKPSLSQFGNDVSPPPLWPSQRNDNNIWTNYMIQQTIEAGVTTIRDTALQYTLEGIENHQYE